MSSRCNQPPPENRCAEEPKPPRVVLPAALDVASVARPTERLLGASEETNMPVRRAAIGREIDRSTKVGRRARRGRYVLALAIVGATPVGGTLVERQVGVLRA